MDTKPIIICAFPGMGKTHLARYIPEPFVALDLDFGHYRSRVLKDERTWLELRGSALSMRDVYDSSTILWPLLRIRYKSVYSYYSHLFTSLMRDVSCMDVDVILTNMLEVVGVIKGAEYWVVTPSSLEWWHSVMNKRRLQMNVDGCSMAKLNKHDQFVSAISAQTLSDWQCVGRAHRIVDRYYSVNDHLTWQKELIARLREIRG